jgi:hypothetical protein
VIPIGLIKATQILVHRIEARVSPLGWALIPVWRKARLARQVNCPAVGHTAVVDLDAWYAVEMHTSGNKEKRVRGCSECPQCSHCRQEHKSLRVTPAMAAGITAKVWTLRELLEAA